MAKFDRLKEEAAYFKLWLGIFAVTDIGLIGWLIVAVDEIDRLRLVLGVLGVVLLSFGVALLHRGIDQRIERIGRL